MSSVGKRKPEIGGGDSCEGEEVPRIVKVSKVEGPDENTDVNIDQAASIGSRKSKLAASPAKGVAAAAEGPEAPSAREIAAAEAARQRLAGGPKASSDAPLEGKLPTGPEPAVVEIEYFASEDLRPLDDAEAQLAGIDAKLQSKEWLVTLASLNTVRQLTLHHRDITSPALEKLAPLVLKLVKSPRSQIIKTAVMCVSDLFRCFAEKMMELLDGDGKPANSLLYQLLLKASSKDKKFVIEATEVTLDVMVAELPAAPLVELLVAYAAHKSPLVRAKAVVSLSKVVQRVGDDAGSFGMDRLVKTGGVMLSDKMQDARQASRELLSVLHAAHRAGYEGEEPQAAWAALCKGNLEATAALGVLKVTGGDVATADNE